MEELLSIKSELRNEQQKVKVLEQKLAIYENEDLEREGYFALKGYIKQQVDFIKEFKLKDEISKNPKDEKFYDRVKSIGEGLKGMLTDLNTLKSELKITKEDESKNIQKTKYRTSPESIAASLGNTAGQTN
jgi:hypothetical protein